MTENRKKSRNRAVQLFLYGCLVLLWQAGYTIGVDVLKVWKPYAMPNPMGVAGSFIELSIDGTLGFAVLYSLMRACLGFCLAVFIGAAVGVLLIQFQTLNRAFKPLILGVQSLPSVCWVPFAILWFGLKEKAILFVVVMGSAFSISLAVENGVKSIPPIYSKAARTMGASKKDLYTKVIFPASLPALIAGMRQGWSFAWRALMSAEVMSASVGLGYTLILGRDLADINQVMLVMLMIILVGILIDQCIFSKIERAVLKKRGL